MIAAFPTAALCSNPFVVKLIDDWNKKGYIETKEIPYIEETILDLKETSIYADDDDEAVESSGEQDASSWFDSVSNKQKTDFEETSRKMREEFQNTIRDQKRQFIDTYLRWREAAKDYQKEEKEYKENLVDYEKLDKKKKVKIKYKKTTEDLPYKVVDKAFDIGIKNQGRRPTCASFAAVYAMEVKKAQKGIKTPLSEQYFYWASKPTCQNKKCTSRGSWVISGLEKSKNSYKKDIPSNKSCPYNQYDQKDNQTQIPLKSSCKNTGVAKVVEYSRISTSSQIRDEINKNNPVVIAVKLSPTLRVETALLVTMKVIKEGQLTHMLQVTQLLSLVTLKILKAKV